MWFADKKRLFTGREIQKGDYLVGLRETGFRSNGLSLVRKIMQEHYGNNWHLKEREGQQEIEMNMARQVMTPSRIYTAAVVDMLGGYNNPPRAQVHGVAHITGRGIPGKLGRVLKPSGLGEVINNPFEPSSIMKHVQKLGCVQDSEAYKTWNRGQGMIIVTPTPNQAVQIAGEYGIEAKQIGYVIRDRMIKIKNKGIMQQTKELFF